MTTKYYEDLANFLRDLIDDEVNKLKAAETFYYFMEVISEDQYNAIVSIVRPVMRDYAKMRAAVESAENLNSENRHRMMFGKPARTLTAEEEELIRKAHALRNDLMDG